MPGINVKLGDRVQWDNGRMTGVVFGMTQSGWAYVKTEAGLEQVRASVLELRADGEPDAGEVIR